MPPYLAMPYFHLSKLPVTTKVGLTVFYLSLCGGFAFVAIVYFPKILEDPKDQAKSMLKRDIGSIEATRNHFAPQEITRETMAKMGAPASDIDEAVNANRKGQLRKAFDIIHPHSFLMPVVYFILLHLMEMTVFWPRARIPLYLVAGTAMVLTVFAPILVLYAPGFGPVCFVALYVMLACFFSMALGPLFTMWFGSAK